MSRGACSHSRRELCLDSIRLYISPSARNELPFSLMLFFPWKINLTVSAGTLGITLIAIQKQLFDGKESPPGPLLVLWQRGWDLAIREREREPACFAYHFIKEERETLLLTLVSFWRWTTSKAKYLSLQNGTNEFAAFAKRAKSLRADIILLAVGPEYMTLLDAGWRVLYSLCINIT